MKKTITMAAVAAMVLSAGVALAAAPVCGDVNDDGSIKTTDALLVLKKAVAQPITLDCSAYDNRFSACETSLAGANASLSTCNSNLSATNTDLTNCEGDLATCEAQPQGKAPKTGQTACYDTVGSVLACAGTGQDGETQNGLGRSFTDNGNGTITDNNSGLMWEKLSDDGSIHDHDNAYSWANAFAGKVATLNGTSFAGYNDWRVPNIAELETLKNFGAVSPSVYSAFNTGCVATCTVTTCSCTQSGFYWSSTANQYNPMYAWYVDFQDGFTGGNSKTPSGYVRAVRAGS